jgi:hypothetical protein
MKNDRYINPPLVGICEENLTFRGTTSIVPGQICYAWPQFPFPILKPWQRALAAVLPRRYRWIVYWLVIEHEE